MGQKIKLNPRFYNNTISSPFCVYEIENEVKVELHYLNDNPLCNQELLQKGRLQAWSTLDGKTYRLLIEKGFYEEVPELYSKKVCEEWAKFFNDLESVKRGFLFKIMLPSMLVYYLALALFAFFMDGQNSGVGTMIVLVGALIGFILLYFLSNTILMKKMKVRQQEAIQAIKKVVGSKNFSKLLDKQDKYIEKYYASLQEANDQVTVANDIDEKENKKEESDNEEAENVKEETNEEIKEEEK